MHIRNLLPIFAVLVSLPADAGKNKVRHSNVVALGSAADAIATDVGMVTAMKSGGGLLVVAGQNGIAAVAPDGTVSWTLELPETMVRNIAVDDSGIAFTSWNLTGSDDRAKAFNAWALGKILDTTTVEGATVGLVSLDGQLLWSTDARDQLALSPPGLGAGSVGVLTGDHIVAYSRADGTLLGETKLENGMGTQPGGALRGLVDRDTRGEMVPMGDTFFTSFFGALYRADAQGKVLDKERAAGLAVYANITCGPIAFGDLVLFGNNGSDVGAKNAFFAMTPQMKNKWKAVSPDEQSGCGDVDIVGDTAYIATNFWVTALNHKGKAQWESVNKKGGLYPSTNRGLTYVGNSAVRKTYGDLMVVGGGRVWIATANGHDVLTVLNAEDGEYIETVDVNETIVSLAVVGDRLVVATTEGLRVLPLGAL